MNEKRILFGIIALVIFGGVLFVSKPVCAENAYSLEYRVGKLEAGQPEETLYKTSVVSVADKEFSVRGNFRHVEGDRQGAESELWVEGKIASDSYGLTVFSFAKFNIFFGKGNSGVDITGNFQGSVPVRLGREFEVSRIQTGREQSGEAFQLRFYLLVEKIETE